MYSETMLAMVNFEIYKLTTRKNEIEDEILELEKVRKEIETKICDDNSMVYKEVS